MAELKTKQTTASVEDFLNAIPDAQRRRDCRTLAALMEEVTQSPPSMWGDSIVGFGKYHYKGASGREGDWFVVGFASRKQDLTLYLMGGLEQREALLSHLGKHKTGKGCLYVKRLADVDMEVLRELVAQSFAHMRQDA